MRAARAAISCEPIVPEALIAGGSYERNLGNFPRARVLNMLWEASPTVRKQAALVSRQGLVETAIVGNGPIRGLFCAAGVFDGDLFAVSGDKLYRGASLIGTITGDGPVSFASAKDELAIAAGGPLYRYNEADGLDSVTIPDVANVRHVSFHDALFLVVPVDSELWYFSGVLDADDWQALNFASAERRPDNLAEIQFLDDTAWMMGEASIEPWANTGEAELPYSRIEQRLFDVGIYDTGCSATLKEAIIFVASDGCVYRLPDLQRLSDAGIEEQIIASASVSAFAYDYESHAVFVVRLDAVSLVYDISSGLWSEFNTYQRANFRAQCAVNVGRDVRLGDDETGTIWSFGGWRDNAAPLVRLWTMAVPMGAPAAINSLCVESNVGVTGLLSGLGSNPIIEARSSRDVGRTWGPWRQSYMGQQGKYRARPEWRRFGLFEQPGALFEGRVTDPVPVRISAARFNEPRGGRGR